MTSNPDWGEKTSGLEVARVFANQIKDRNVVITGVSPNGIGKTTALAIASQAPATLILASRTKEKVETAAAEIKNAHPTVDVQVVLLDLASQRSVRDAAAEITRLLAPGGRRLDLLINNAGVSLMWRKWTAEHIEMQLGANHVGHFLLTKLLMPLLLESAAAAAAAHAAGSTRVVNLSSLGHRLSPIRFHDYNFELLGDKGGDDLLPLEERPAAGMPPAFAQVLEDGYMPLVAYGQSKTANVLFTLSLQEGLRARGIASYAVHPGGINTELGREQTGDVAEAISKTSKYWKTLDEGASTTLVAALDPALNDTSAGLFLSDCQFVSPAEHASDPAAAEKLWKLSEELIGEQWILA